MPVGGFLGTKGRTIRSALFALKSFPSALPHSRWGVVAGKKVSKTAVGRNAVRRKFFDAVARLPENVPVADYLIIAHPGAEKAILEELYEQLVSLLAS